MAQKALAFYPAPNAAVGPFSRNNYFVNHPETNTANGMIARLDQSAGGRQRFGLTLQFSNGFFGASKLFPTAANSGPADRRTESRKGTFKHVFTVSSHTVNRLSFSADSVAVRGGDSANAGDFSGALGLRAAADSAFPVFNIAPYVSMGQAYPRTSNASNIYTWAAQISRRRGSHTLKAGVNYSLRQVNFFGAQYPSGAFTFGSGLTGLPGITGTGLSFASFLLGQYEYAESSVEYFHLLISGEPVDNLRSRTSMKFARASH